jgi:hypothetical protein
MHNAMKDIVKAKGKGTVKNKLNVKVKGNVK